MIFNKLRMHLLYQLAYLLWYVHLPLCLYSFLSILSTKSSQRKDLRVLVLVWSCITSMKAHSSAERKYKNVGEKSIKCGYLHTKNSLFKDALKYFSLDYNQETILYGSALSLEQEQCHLWFQTIFWAFYNFTLGQFWFCPAVWILFWICRQIKEKAH